ncbi:cytochrome C biogenesis protein CcmH [Clostridium botulinum]|nr:cytochrome C biogenesis protein CcmH [Clostridium botulinum]
MKNCFKKILIMFVIALTIMSIGIMKNVTIANAATVGQQLIQPEDGWKRYDDTDSKIVYENYVHQDNNGGSTSFVNDLKYFLETRAICENNVGKIKFSFYGSNFRIISDKYHPYRIDKINIIIDGVKQIAYPIDNDRQELETRVVQYESNNLKLGKHSVIIEKNLDMKAFVLDAIDIDDNGYLLDWQDESISLNKSSLSLKEGTSEKLEATTTPSAIDVIWSSSDNTIATVDENGKVTGIKEGTCTVTAKIDGTDLAADCIVTVTKEDIVEPEEPSIESGSLYIEMVDGNIKRADKSQIEKFKKWFISRDLDETESPIFKITNAKGNVEYLVHDKVIGFEIREE